MRRLSVRLPIRMTKLVPAITQEVFFTNIFDTWLEYSLGKYLRQVRPPGLGSIQFRNWNCSSIPIPELELELKLVELKMELELKTLELELELELKTGIEFFLQLLLQQLLVKQPFPNFSFNRGGHNLSCDWLFMQQVFLGHWPLWYGHKRYMGRVPCSPWVDKGLRRIKDGDKKYRLPPWHK